MTPFYADEWLTIFEGDCREVLAGLPSDSVDCVVTSPPYWGLRDYGTATWEGGDDECDHNRTVRRFKDGCVGCGCAMQDVTPGCDNCDARHRMRKIGGTDPARAYEEPSEHHWDKPRSRDQVTATTVPYQEVCGKCGATRQDSQLGLERTPEEYVANMVAVFREVRRVLKPSGTCWLNLGDSYAAGGSRQNGYHDGRTNRDKRQAAPFVDGLKPKDLVGIPWRVAFALQGDGWYLRSDIIWSKPNPMPESVTDRPTKSHEYLFLLTKSARYFFDSDAVREALLPSSVERGKYGWSGKTGDALEMGATPSGGGFNRLKKSGETMDALYNPAGRNIRSVWTIATRPYPGAHFAVFPPELPERCIKAGSSERGVCPECGAPLERRVALGAVKSTGGGPGRAASGSVIQDRGDYNSGKFVEREHITLGWAVRCVCFDGDEREVPTSPAVVLDPFAGSGTVGLVANRLSRRAILIDLNPEYLKQQMKRNAQTPLGLSEGDAA